MLAGRRRCSNDGRTAGASAAAGARVPEHHGNMRRAIARLAGLVAACSAAGCGVAAPRVAPPAPSVAAARYEVHVASTEPWVLAVELTLVGGADGLVASEVPASV